MKAHLHLVTMALLAFGCGGRASPPTEPGVPSPSDPPTVVTAAAPTSLRPIARLGERRFHSEVPIRAARFWTGHGVVVATDEGIAIWDERGERTTSKSWKELDEQRLVGVTASGRLLLGSARAVHAYGPKLTRLATVVERDEPMGSFASEGDVVAYESARRRGKPIERDVVIHDLAKDAEIGRVTVQGSVKAIAVSPTGRHLAVARFVQGCGEVYTADGERAFEIPHRRLGCDALAFSNDGARLAVAHGSEELEVWDVGKGEAIHTARYLGDDVERLTWNGELLFAEAHRLSEHWIRRYDLTTKEVADLAGRSVAIDADGEHLITVFDHGLMRCDVATLDCETTQRHAGAVVGLAAQGPFLVSAADDGSVLWWQLGDGLEAARSLAQSFRTGVPRVVASPHGLGVWTRFERGENKRYVSDGSSRESLRWFTLQGAPAWDVHDHATLLGPHPYGLRSLGVDDEDVVVRGVDGDGDVYEWDLRDGKHRATLPLAPRGYDASDRVGQLSPTGRAVLYRREVSHGSVADPTTLWRLPSGVRTAHELRWPCAFDAPGRRLVCRSLHDEDRDDRRLPSRRDQPPRTRLQLLSLETDAEARSFTVEGDVSSLALADGRIAMVQDRDGEGVAIVVVDEDGEELVRATWDGAAITAMTFAASGARLVTGHADGAVRIWRL